MSLGNYNDTNDLESSILQQFSRMQTSNRDDLILEFQRLLAPNQLTEEGCKFFLDMNNWNLQQAICAYFDYDQHKLLQQPLPFVTLIGDVTIGEGEEVAPNTRFVKTWKLANSGTYLEREFNSKLFFASTSVRDLTFLAFSPTGTMQWPSGCFLAFISGCKMGTQDRVPVEPLKPNEQVDVSVSLLSPQVPGIYQGQWRMCTNTGQYFGDIIWCIISVSECGLLSLTQQMNSINVTGPLSDTQQRLNPNRIHHSLVQRIEPNRKERDSEMQTDESDNKN